MRQAIGWGLWVRESFWQSTLDFGAAVCHARDSHWASPWCWGFILPITTTWALGYDQILLINLSMWDAFEARLHEIYLCVQDVCRPSMWGHKPVQLSSSNSATMFGCCSFSKWFRIYSPHRLENYIIGKPDHIAKLELLLSLMYVGHCWEQFSCLSSLKTAMAV
jgi:hypothetical protein